MKSVLTIGNSIYVRLNKFGLENFFFPKIIFKDFKIDYYNVHGLDSNILKNENILNQVKDNQYNYIIICLGIVDCFPRYNESKNSLKINKDYIPNNYWQHVDFNTFKENFISFVNYISSESKNTKILIQSIFIPNNKICNINSFNFNYYEYLKKEVILYNIFLESLKEKNQNIYFLNLNKNIEIVINKYNITYEDFFPDTSTHISPIEVYPNLQDRIKYCNIFTELVKISFKNLNLQDENLSLII